MNKDKLLDIYLFKNFTVKELNDALNYLDGTLQSYKTNEVIFSAGSKTSTLGIVLKGNVVIEATDFLGIKTIMRNITVGSVFGETYGFVEGKTLMLDIVSTTQSQILFLDLEKLYDGNCKEKEWYGKIMENLLHIACEKNINLTNRSFHTMSKSIRGRVTSYLTSQIIYHKKNSFSIPFNRQELADYLNLDRSSLSRELSKMEKEGILTFYKNKFTIKSDILSKRISGGF